MNLTYHKASLLESAKRLRNFTNDNLVKMSDPTDLSYILATIENYLTYLPSENEVNGSVIFFCMIFFFRL